MNKKDRSSGDGNAVEHQECAAALDLIALHERHPDRYPYLLQSVAAGPVQARFDILFAHPAETLVLQLDGTLQQGDQLLSDNDFLKQLDDWWQQNSSKSDHAIELPFYGGWFLYLGYELASQVEPNLKLPMKGFAKQLPVAYATRIPAAIIRDHHHNKNWLIAESGRAELLDVMQRDVGALMPSAVNIAEGPFVTGLIEDEPTRYLNAVNRVKQYIIDGDVFQANLSREWCGEIVDGVSVADIYRRLCQQNPAPFAGLACYQDSAVISSSPERLVDLKDGQVSTRPIAGTRPRASNDRDDQALSEALMQHPKERAEHIMLIDLERNDLGRVCEPGTIEVDEFMVLESYAHVHHIVSNVRGRKRQEVSPGEIIRALFPGGTITGCPKVRCMEIIAELEQTTRGPYTGSMGYLNRDGSMDLNILIRTIVTEGRALSLRAGAGIVADSNAAAELIETRIKARGLLRALGVNDAD
ncbi:MAG: aminodeoxychorismate synthase component I [Thiotrichaceae bacterium]|nr:aminodeoxychorismate synthase component I [Thiotrichaceae bacterium]PCI15026.1 MAG: aminodeoxychorismate synthase, component I [Thiotrichales bacterium]